MNIFVPDRPGKFWAAGCPEEPNIPWSKLPNLSENHILKAPFKKHKQLTKIHCLANLRNKACTCHKQHNNDIDVYYSQWQQLSQCTYIFGFSYT